MNDPYFFGYGSLVNTATHIYDNAHPAKVKGWRRVWKHTHLRDLAFLSVEPCDSTQIEGLIAKVPGANWNALDERETGYVRAPLAGEEIEHPAGPLPVEMYRVAAHSNRVAAKPLLLSYIDVVVQGFLRTYGEDGVQRFFDTTHGWHAPIMNDRANPKYPRAQKLTADETSLVDQHLMRVTRD
ncbi:hypothetical protein C8N43_3633 [Litoreibacter ponti]|uniref:Gamma-glutamyl AIG2-like cyclotransferase n=1 Tax=Litoreibacter ponti TaxID=1510457 RepID=A0A2T6BFH0_9RHOB|nr:gamma-glutamylcyclotransferase family protein [Litoreibacter ponti]PTX54812.1 hypothetical protein C8N43_3633 [Litoreibacter ponti]